MSEVNTLDGWKIAQFVVTVMVAVFAWLWKGMRNEVDVLKATAVTRADLKESFAQQRADHETMDKRNQLSLQRIEDKLDKAQEAGVIVTRIDRHEEDIEDLRTWKHQVDPFIKRRVDP